MATPRRVLSGFKRIRSALVVLCLVAFSVVNVVHAAHHVGLQSQTASLTTVAPAGDMGDPADASTELAETCLVCALTTAPIELFAFSVLERTPVEVATALHAGSSAGRFIEAPPPRA